MLQSHKFALGDNKIIIRGAIILAVVVVVVAATVILSILATWHRKKITICKNEC